MEEANETANSAKAKGPDFSGIVESNPCGFITRARLPEATGYLISSKWAAAMDSDPELDGIHGRFKIGRKVCYPVNEVVAFLKRKTLML